MVRDEKSMPLHLFLRVSLKNIKGGYVAEPVHGGTNTLTTLIKANGFIIVPPNKHLRKGEEVEVTLFSHSELSCIQ
ncbi:MAG: hypothetical protein ABIH76_03255 [Candidatus Bathyarchaeota archaeon]